jgi:GNAT superfamily N-acetyltransferase
VAFEIRPLRRDDRVDFDSGEEPLNQFFRRFARDHQFKHGISATTVAAGDDKIGGFVTLTGSTVLRGDLLTTGSLPSFPLPVLLVARLAVAVDAQGQGLGSQLVAVALRAATKMRREIGCLGVEVHAKPAAVAFYQRYGFTPITGSNGPQTRMFLRYGLIEKAE